MIDVQNLSFGYGKEKLLSGVSCRISNGETVGLIGPNGAGKTTMLRLMAGILKPNSGTVLVDGRPLKDYPPKALARQLAFLPQSRPTPAISVKTLVGLGRFAHDKGNRETVENAIHTAGLDHLANRDVRTLSGGQRQMACLAMLLAQASPNVLLDEPMTHLDIGAQLDVADMIRRMKEDGKCVVVVLHDLHMLKTVCDRAILLDRGEIVFDGEPAACLQSQAFEQAFHVKTLTAQGVRFARR